MNEETYNPNDLQKELYKPKSPLKSINEQKLEILKQYEVVFKGIDVNTITTAPIMWPKPVLMSRIEQCYDKQFERLMQMKSKQALNLPDVINKTFKMSSSKNLTFFRQSLCNLIYSADKYSDLPEAELFLRFVLAKPPNLQFLFYLYLRQHFKIITYTNFHNAKQTDQDPSKVSTTFKIAESIIKQAFYSDAVAYKKLVKALSDNFNKKERVGYYDFLTTMCAVDLNYRDLEMMEHLIALYTIKSREELGGKSSTQQIEDGAENVFNMHDEEDDDFLGKSGMEYTEDGSLIKADFKADIEQNNIESFNEKTAFTKQNKVAVKNTANTQKNVNYANLDLHEQLVAKRNIQRDKRDRTLQNLIKAELKTYVNKLVANFVKSNHISIEDLNYRTQSANKQVHNKLFYIITSIFINDRSKFFGLMRKDMEKDEDTLQFWDSLQNEYDGLKDLDSSSPAIAKDFLNKLFENEIIAEEIMFFLNFHFRNDQDIVNCNVAVELEQAE